MIDIIGAIICILIGVVILVAGIGILLYFVSLLENIRFCYEELHSINKKMEDLLILNGIKCEIEVKP
jgi:hypothetical protein